MTHRARHILKEAGRRRAPKKANACPSLLADFPRPTTTIAIHDFPASKGSLLHLPMVGYACLWLAMLANGWLGLALLVYGWLCLPMVGYACLWLPRLGYDWQWLPMLAYACLW